MKKPAVPQVPPQSVNPAQLAEYVNKELLPVVSQLREVANHSSSFRGSVVTSLGAGAYITLWTSEALPTDGVWAVEATVVGVSTSGSPQRGVYSIHGAIQSTAGAVALLSTPITDAMESSAGIDARLTADATNRTLVVEARDDATSPMRFQAVVKITEVLL